MKPKDRIKRLLKVAKNPLTGLEIANIVNVWRSTIYIHLSQLEDKGEIKSNWDPTDTQMRIGSPEQFRRRVYWMEV